MKDDVLNLTREIVASEMPDELSLYTMFESSLYDVAVGEKEHILGEHSHFGGQESISAYYILAIIAWVSNTLANEGIKVGKIVLYKWIKENKSKILQRYNSKKYSNAIKVIELYLEKEIKK